MGEDIDFGKRIKEFRELKQLSQQALADQSGLSRSTINNIESGRQRPSIEFLIDFSEITGYTINTILGIQSSESSKTLEDQNQSNIIRQLQETIALKEQALAASEKRYNDLIDQLRQLRDKFSDLL